MGRNKQKRKEEEAINLALHDILSLPENSKCADCSEPAPRWASVNVGCFLCIRCAGIHRNLGTSVSVIKSTTLDNWTAEWVKNMADWGNKRVNGRYLSGKNAPNPPTNSDYEMEKYIRNKYEKKMYMTGGGGGASSQASSSSSAKVEMVKPGDAEKYSKQLRSLAQMGFNNVDRAIIALKKSDGSVDGAVEILVSQVEATPPKVDSPKAVRLATVRAAQSESIQMSPSGGDVSDAKKKELAAKLQAALEALNALGFTDDEANKAALKQAGGRIDQAANILIDQRQKRGNAQDFSLTQASIALGKPPAGKQRQTSNQPTSAPSPATVKPSQSQTTLGVDLLSLADSQSKPVMGQPGTSTDPFASFFAPPSNAQTVNAPQLQQENTILQLQQQNLMLQQQLQAQQQLQNTQQQQRQISANNTPFGISAQLQPMGTNPGSLVQHSQMPQAAAANPFGVPMQQQATPFGALLSAQGSSQHQNVQPNLFTSQQQPAAAPQQQQQNPFTTATNASVSAQQRQSSDPFGLGMAALQPQNLASQRTIPQQANPFSSVGMMNQSMLISQPAAAPTIPLERPQPPQKHTQQVTSPKDSIMAMYNAPTPMQQQQMMLQNAMANGQIIMVMQQPAPGALAGIRPLMPQSGGGVTGGPSYSTFASSQPFGQQNVPRQGGGVNSAPTGPFSNIQAPGMGFPPATQQQQPQQLGGGKGNPFF